MKYSNVLIVSFILAIGAQTQGRASPTKTEMPPEIRSAYESMYPSSVNEVDDVIAGKRYHKCFTGGKSRKVVFEAVKPVPAKWLESVRYFRDPAKFQDVVPEVIFKLHEALVAEKHWKLDAMEIENSHRNGIVNVFIYADTAGKEAELIVDQKGNVLVYEADDEKSPFPIYDRPAIPLQAGVLPWYSDVPEPVVYNFWSMFSSRYGSSCNNYLVSKAAEKYLVTYYRNQGDTNKYIATFMADGKWLETKKLIGYDELSKAAKKVVADKYGKREVQVFAIVDNDERGICYELTVGSTVMNSKVFMDFDGTVMK